MAEPVTLTWPGGEHGFLLRLGELRALDDRVQGGAYAAFYRMQAAQPRPDDVLETLRLGLTGGGMKSDEAARLVRVIEEQYGIGALLPTAQYVLYRAFHRREEGSGAGKPRPAEVPPAS